MKNRILAMLLCGCIILSMFPGNIMAEGNSNDENGTSIQNVGDDQRVLYLSSGSYNSNSNTFSSWGHYTDGMWVNYTGTGYYQLYYGIQNNYGDPVTVKNWSYTAPEGITGSSVTLTEKTDKNGVVFYEIAAQYMGDETCTGTLNITLSDGTETSFSISFQKPSQGWYTKPENTAANY
ncbi:MAG: hypothetical protein IJE90_02405, partial [Clostridia bacterium]|nr:hypothetical protein [Clostridia bacterium]